MAWSQGGKEYLRTIKRRANWVGSILRRNCLLKYIIEGKIERKYTWWEDKEEDVSSCRLALMKQEDREIERWSTSSLSVQNTLWKRLWNWRITDYMLKAVVVVMVVEVVVVVVVMMIMIYGVSGDFMSYRHGSDLQPLLRSELYNLPSPSVHDFLPSPLDNLSIPAISITIFCFQPTYFEHSRIRRSGLARGAQYGSVSFR